MFKVRGLGRIFETERETGTASGKKYTMRGDIEVLPAVTVTIAVLWDVTPRNLADTSASALLP
jgi:hypothetical protein